MKWLKNVKIVNYNKTINNADLEIENGLIKTIIEKDGVGTKVLIPGFIDTHTHGISGVNFMDGDKAIEKITNTLCEFGVTSIFPTISTNEIQKMESALRAISEFKSRGSNILGIHCEGPFISLMKRGVHDTKFIIKGNESILMKLYNASQGKLKKITFAPEEVEDSFINKMTEIGIMPTIGHSNATFERTIEAIEGGSLNCAHLWNHMSGIKNKQPGLAQAVIFDDRIFSELIADFIHVDESTLLFTLKTKGVDKIMLVSGSGPNNEKGKDNPSSTIYDGFKNIISLGISLQDAVSMSSYNIAKSLNLIGKGVIQEGMDADLVLLNNDLSIDSTYVKGVKK